MSPAEGNTEKMHRAVLAWLDARLASGCASQLVPIAEAITEKLLAGGSLYVAGDPAFGDELYYRAGRFAATKIFKGERLTAADVLLVGLMAQNDKGSRYFAASAIARDSVRINAGLTVVFGSARWPQIERMQLSADKRKWASGLFFVDTDAPAGTTLENLALGQLASVALATVLEGELAAAMTRKGRTLAMLSSIKAPGGKAFCEQIKDKVWLDVPRLELIAAGRLGREYLDACRRQLAGFCSSGQPERVRLGAKRLAECQQRGGVIWTVTEGHLHARGATVPSELSQLFVYGPAWEWQAPRGLKPGDTLLFVGYIDYPQEAVDAVLALGADAVVISVDEGRCCKQVTWIASCWEAYDGVVTVPGYPCKILPSSGVVQTPQWYSLMAETVRVLAGKS